MSKDSTETFRTQIIALEAQLHSCKLERERLEGVVRELKNKNYELTRDIRAMGRDQGYDM